MTDPHPESLAADPERLAERAIFGLDSTQPESGPLNDQHTLIHDDSLDRFVADIVLSGLPLPLDPLPAHLVDRIIQSAPVYLPPEPIRDINPSTIAMEEKTRSSRLVPTILAMLAMTLVVTWIVWPMTKPPSPAQQRELLLARSSPDSPVLQLDWSVTEDPAARGASGDLVWDSKTQQGYMRFRGLAANRPDQEQYQLWVFDAQRDERYPVDGGVFDIPDGVDVVVIPINAKLYVNRPVLFAITVEPPGGVVVSSRARLPLLAKVSSTDS